jgi:hypothetical protein
VREPDGTITSFDAPEAPYSIGSASINAEGTTTGYFFNSSGVAVSFIRTRGGEITTFEVPGAAGLGTAAFSINVFGAVTGEFFDANNVMHGFSRSATGVFTTFDAPGAGTTANAFQGTRPSTNNFSGAITGWWVDGNGVNHGFVLTSATRFFKAPVL